jgi:hypothetical protein
LGLAAGGGAASPSVLASSSSDTQKTRSFEDGLVRYAAINK